MRFEGVAFDGVSGELRFKGVSKELGGVWKDPRFEGLAP